MSQLQEEDKQWDVVIVGGGVTGAIISKVLAKKGYQVAILEAGVEEGLNFNSYQTFLERFYDADVKDTLAPYPPNSNALSPGYKDTELQQDQYYIQKGVNPFLSTYTRIIGGTTMHWLGTCLRMLPEDFALKTRFGQGLDWPIDYQTLSPYYNAAEREIGVSADVDEQEYLGIAFDPGYQYPMRKIPQSYLDQTLGKRIDGPEITVEGETFRPQVRSTPQGRNSIPNAGYTPVGAVGSPDPLLGDRCAGNTSCVPICPVQAKYNAMKTLQPLVKTGKVQLIAKAVAYKVELDDSGRVEAICYKEYPSRNSPKHVERKIRGRYYVLAANAIENAKLLLLSNITSTSELVGKNLMDHPVLLTWGLLPEMVGPFRGPLSTSGIEDLRGGEFRRARAAFRVEIGNEGWNWCAGAPNSDVTNLVNQHIWGRELRRKLAESMPRQFRFGFLVEQLPETSNTVTIDPRYKDRLGINKPVLTYSVNDYTLAGMAFAKKFSDALFKRIHATDYTTYDPKSPGYVEYQGEGYVYNGAGHLAGTHIMGTDKTNSVVDRYQRSWDHQNLYIAGCGSMPTMATSNPTLTISALAYMTAESLIRDLSK